MSNAGNWGKRSSATRGGDYNVERDMGRAEATLAQHDRILKRAKPIAKSRGFRLKALAKRANTDVVTFGHVLNNLIGEGDHGEISGKDLGIAEDVFERVMKVLVETGFVAGESVGIFDKDLVQKLLNLKTALDAPNSDVPERLANDSTELVQKLFDTIVSDGLAKDYPQIPPEIARSLCEIAWKNTTPGTTPEDYSAMVHAACAKWLDLHWKLPAGYTAVSFGQWLVEQGGITFFDDVAQEIGSTANHVAEVVGRMSGEDKIRFVRSADGQPGVFVAKMKGKHGDDQVNWPDEEKRIADLILMKFEKEGEFDAVSGEIAPNIPVAEWVDKSASDFAKLAKAAGLSKTAARGVLEDFQKNGNLIITWLAQMKEFKVHLRVRDYPTLTESQKRIARALESEFETESAGRLRATDQPVKGPRTYAEAIRQQYAALEQLLRIEKKGREMGGKVQGLTVRELASNDIEALRIADTFAWYDDPINAVEAASVSLPSSARLMKDHVPGAAGWWYFFRPLDLRTTTDSYEVIAVLWHWVTAKNRDIRIGARQGVYFSLYVDGSKDGIGPSPTSKFLWIEGESIAHLVQRVGHEHDSRYLPGGDLIDQVRAPELLLGKEITLQVVERIARFFAAGCLWMEQKILVRTSRPYERHERKRIEKTEVFARPLSDIQVIELRRRQSEAKPSSDGEHTVRDWKCRWTVSGHWRNQFYPSKGNYAPKWIDPYDKGPEGLPFKVPSHKVYAVKR